MDQDLYAKAVDAIARRDKGDFTWTKAAGEVLEALIEQHADDTPVAEQKWEETPSDHEMPQVPDPEPEPEKEPEPPFEA